MEYPVVLERDDNDTIHVSFPDFPGHTFGDDEAEALHARDALRTIIDAYLANGRALPEPSPLTTGYSVQLD